jgi:glycosyltransferase involved in cell wall biosynthesis
MASGLSALRLRGSLMSWRPGGSTFAVSLQTHIRSSGGADLFASASWVEGFGNAIWEALACGVPVVAMDCGAPVRSLVRNGVDGIIVRTKGALVEALRSLMGDEGLRKALAARALEVLTRFPVEASLQAWDALLDDVTLNLSDSSPRYGADRMI